VTHIWTDGRTLRRHYRAHLLLIGERVHILALFATSLCNLWNVLLKSKLTTSYLSLSLSNIAHDHFVPLRLTCNLPLKFVQYECLPHVKRLRDAVVLVRDRFHFANERHVYIVRGDPWRPQTALQNADNRPLNASRNCVERTHCLKQRPPRSNTLVSCCLIAGTRRNTG